VTEVRDKGMGNAASLTSQLGGLAGIAGLNLGFGNEMNRESKAVLNSRRLIEEFIERNNLIPVLYPPPAHRPTLWRAVEQFRRGILSITEDARKGVTTVAIEWRDPAVSARWANEFVALANQRIRSRALDDSNRNIAYLNEQIAHTNVVELQRVMYNLIENETKTAMFANSRAEYAYTLVDPAVPPEIRAHPKRTLILLLGGLIGLILGGVVAFVHHTWVSRSHA